ncbi:MAG: hypothetical protein FWC28_08725 [Proteobacteria bacterium]|nr:hypothetical protein [Cystobacterineae bacterium]MCL2259429.1 hypothetical protein [Cystobacterineae bacterium]MCL2315313.1 hypothetical protein [Pseudomonadota bacterium]
MTQRYMGIFLCLVALLGSMVFAMRGWNAAKFDADKALSRIRLKTDYMERVAWMRSVPDEAKYQVEVKNFLRWYFEQTGAHIRAFNLNAQFDDYLKELAIPGNADRLEERKKVYENVRSIFDLMQKGDYSPEWSASSQGVRLDVLSARIVWDEKGERKIRYQLVVWGLPREQRVDEKGLLRIQSRATFTAHWHMFDLKGKRVAKMQSGGNMPGRIDWPERYVSMFPADVTLGHYDVDLMPSNVEVVEVHFDISSPSLTGGSMNPNFVWKQNVPFEWRLRPGELWRDAQPVAGLSAAQ